MKKTRKGFTLVELLIVIVVIVVLASMMMMSSSEAVTSARATAIVSNLRNLKTAALAYFNDNMELFDNWSRKSEFLKTSEGNAYGVLTDGKYNELLGYLNGKDEFPDKNSYVVEYGGSDKNYGWYVYFDFEKDKTLTDPEKTRIKKKLAGRAGALGLINSQKNHDEVFKSTHNKVGLQIR